MIGNSVSLRDIVLEELPCNVSLYCDEQLLPSDDEEEEPEQVQQDLFSVEITCPVCDNRLFFCVLSSPATVRQLHTLLLRDLGILCFSCAQRKEQDGA